MQADCDEMEFFDEDELLEGMVEKRFCMNCGIGLSQNPNGRPKKFCCDKCRREYWNTHETPARWNSYEKLRCPICGKTFYSKKIRNGKYCSKTCSNRGRGLRI